MRIALFNALYPTPLQPKIFGGAEVLVRQIAERLAAQGNEVVVVRLSLDGQRLTEEANGVRVEFVPIRNLFTPFGPRHNALAHLAWHAIDDWFVAPGEIAGILDGFRPQVVHSHTLNGLNAHIWQLARHRGVPVVHTLHDYYLVCPRYSRFKGETSCTATCGSCAALTVRRRQRAGLVNAVVGVSQRTLDIHVKDGLFADAARHVICNMPNPDIAFVPLDLPGRPLRVGYLGRFSPEKGVRLLAEAAGRLPPGTVKLVLAGNFAQEERAALARQTELDFVGFVAPKDFYGQVDVAAVPSNLGRAGRPGAAGRAGRRPSGAGAGLRRTAGDVRGRPHRMDRGRMSRAWPRPSDGSRTRLPWCSRPTSAWRRGPPGPSTTWSPTIRGPIGRWWIPPRRGPERVAVAAGIKRSPLPRGS